ncbi:MAG: radical SAM protein [Bacteroidia bacterium]|nr:radical SAM protein [Bacteroidia bacterium]
MISNVLEPEIVLAKEGSPSLFKNKPTILKGFQMRVLHTLMRLHLVLIAMKCYRNPAKWIGSLVYLIRLRRRFLGDFKLKKVARVNGKYHMGIYIPAWFSKGFEYFVMNELKSYKPISRPSYRFNNVFLAITSKCPLQCEHCYEWERLNQREHDNTDRLKTIIDELSAKGTCQIHFTGGEPLVKTEIILDLMRTAPKDIDYWITTSGYSLDESKAKKLKAAGIKGIVISLDHFEAEEHNRFRNHPVAFYWAIEAVKNTISNNMIAALSVCVTKEFIIESNLMSYMIMAEKLGVSFVQFIEPKPIGHFKGKAVELDAEDMKVLEQFHLKMNFSNSYLSVPIIGYHEQYQRRQRCLSAGNRSIYLDMQGNLHACPFCQKKRGNILDSNFDNQLDTMTRLGCEAVSC